MPEPPITRLAASLPRVGGSSLRLSGERPGTRLPIAAVDAAGRRFLQPRPAGLPQPPLRVYGALGHGSSEEERVRLVLEELARTGAYDRDVLLVAIPTGAGHVNPVALEAVERMAGGDVASVAIQYGTRPSALSFDKVDDAERVHGMLLAGIRAEIARRFPDGGGPRVLLYGESLGAWAGQNLVGRAPGPDKLGALGIDRAAWVGAPGFSGFTPAAMPPGQAVALEGIAELHALPRATRRSARAWMLEHRDDPVHRASLRLAWQPPEERLGAVPWLPGLTFLGAMLAVLLDRNTAKPGEFTARGHDYRLELPRLLRTAYGFEDRVSGDRADRMLGVLARSEQAIMDVDWAEGWLRGRARSAPGVAD